MLRTATRPTQPRDTDRPSATQQQTHHHHHVLPPHIQRQLEVLTRSELALQDAVRELSEYSGPQAQVMLRNDQIRGDMRALARGIEDLRFAAEEEDRPSDTEVVLEKVAQHEELQR
ncbi:hypothetical protein HKX48_003515, partial [Thoreauomyces humboldtii]